MARAKKNTVQANTANPVTIQWKGQTMQFEETDYVAPQRPGRTAEENPYIAAFERAAQMKVSAPGKQLTVVVQADEVAKHRRFVRLAADVYSAKEGNPKLSAGIKEEKISDTEVRFSFRAIDYVPRPKKNKTETPAVASLTETETGRKAEFTDGTSVELVNA